MPRTDISFRTSDGTLLHGWLYTPTPTPSSAHALPCLILSHGFSALKEMSLDNFASTFSNALPIACVVYDQRGFGASENAPHQPRGEILPDVQVADLQDAITYVQSRDDLDARRVGIWGSSYSGGHVLSVAGVDRRVRAVISQVPAVSGWEIFHRLIRPDVIVGLNGMFEADRLSRAAGKPPGMIPVVSNNPLEPCALPSADSYAFFTGWAEKCGWKNETTVRSIEVLKAYDPSNHIQHISPTPLLMVVAENDVVTPTDLALMAYGRALEPKELLLLPGGHFDSYEGPNFEVSVKRQIEFLKKYLCDKGTS